MIIIFPLVPILIAVFLLCAALLNQASEVIGTIITIAWILVIASSVILIICNLRRKTTIENKILGTIISIAATIITTIVSKTFLFGLAASSDTSSITGVIEFGFVFIFGGVVWLGVVGLCAYASYNSANDYGEGNIFSVLSLIGSLVLAGIFGLLG